MFSVLILLASQIGVQDRAISVSEFIQAFDSEQIRHVASKELGDSIIFVHAPESSAETLKDKLAKTLSASWRKTDTGFRLERTQAQTRALEAKEVAERASLLKEYQRELSKKLQDNASAERRANAALQSLMRLQEKYRSSRPNAFKPETEMAADWLLFSLLNKIDATEIASMSLYSGRQLSDKPTGDQRPLPSGSGPLIEAYVRDRREVNDFSQTILDTTAEGPMSYWIKQTIERARQPHTLERIMFRYGRSSDTFSAGLFLFDTEGVLFDSSSVWIPAIGAGSQIEVATVLTADFDEIQRAFVDRVYGYSFIRDPHPEAIDKIMGVEPLCAAEPLFRELAKSRAKPSIVVLDDRLVEAMDYASGKTKNVANFIRKAEEQGSITLQPDDKWLILRPRYLLDSENRRVDRSALKPFLESTKKAGYVTIEGHISVNAASPQAYTPLVSHLLAYLDGNGYVLVQEKDQYLAAASRLMKELLKMRGGVPRATVEVPASSLSSTARAELWKWASAGIATIEARPGHSPSQLQRHANFAFPSGLPANAVVRIIPNSSGCVGLKEPFPTAYSAEGLGWACGGYEKPPREMMAGTYLYGERRGVRLEVLLSPALMLSNQYFEAARDMKEMRGYDSLPAEFRKEVERGYEEMRKALGGGTTSGIFGRSIGTGFRSVSRGPATDMQPEMVK